MIKRILLGVFCSLTLLASQAQTTLDTAPDFIAKDIQGITHRLFTLLDSNKYVLLDFFTTSCGPCVTYAPDIQQAYIHFGANQADVFFLGINYGDDNSGVALFDSLYGISFPTVSGQEGHGNAVALQVFDIQSFPTMVLIAPNRLILNKQIFPPGFQQLDSTISSALGLVTAGNDRKLPYKEFIINGVYPNPVRAVASIILEVPAPVIIDYQVMNLTGNIVLEKRSVPLKKGTQTLPVSVAGLHPGIYFARFINDRKVSGIVKFIIQP